MPFAFCKYATCRASQRATREHINKHTAHRTPILAALATLLHAACCTRTVCSMAPTALLRIQPTITRCSAWQPQVQHQRLRAQLWSRRSWAPRLPRGARGTSYSRTRPRFTSRTTRIPPHSTCCTGHRLGQAGPKSTQYRSTRRTQSTPLPVATCTTTLSVRCHTAPSFCTPQRSSWCIHMYLRQERSPPFTRLRRARWSVVSLVHRTRRRPRPHLRQLLRRHHHRPPLARARPHKLRRCRSGRARHRRQRQLIHRRPHKRRRRRRRLPKRKRQRRHL